MGLDKSILQNISIETISNAQNQHLSDPFINHYDSHHIFNVNMRTWNVFVWFTWRSGSRSTNSTGEPTASCLTSSWGTSTSSESMPSTWWASVRTPATQKTALTSRKQVGSWLHRVCNTVQLSWFWFHLLQVQILLYYIIRQKMELKNLCLSVCLSPQVLRTSRPATRTMTSQRLPSSHILWWTAPS